ncbi:MAG: hypothetical protein IKK83_00255 [Clostridia bacterium]|nr:hypothetical protein [Clostridia bacterium]
MRCADEGKGFVLSLLFNMLLNLHGALPAVVLLVLHFVLGWSPYWALIAFVLWLGRIVVWMVLVRLASRAGNSRVYTENKNPYSKKKDERENKNPYSAK